MADRRTPEAAHSREAESIHDTQTSLESLSSELRPRSPEVPAAGTDMPSSGLGSEAELDARLAKRLSALEDALVEVQARVRLLEKQTPRRLVYWFLALLFFVALAVSWRLISPTR